MSMIILRPDNALIRAGLVFSLQAAGRSTGAWRDLRECMEYMCDPNVLQMT